LRSSQEIWLLVFFFSLDATVHKCQLTFGFDPGFDCFNGTVIVDEEHRGLIAKRADEMSVDFGRIREHRDTYIGKIQFFMVLIL